MKGIILKGIGGFYYVKAGEAVYTCKARGIFKKDGMVPMVGDVVDMEIIDGEEGVINEIFPRKNAFVRPPISNVDRLAVVMAAAQPKPNLTLMDKFLVMAEKSDTKIILCINKKDLAKKKTMEEIITIYGGSIPSVR